jgi:hypothetical protein
MPNHRLNTDQHRQAPIRSILGVALILFAVAPALYAQATAPLPTQLTTASKVFISNAGEQDNIDCLRAYNEFYAGIAASNYLQPILTPSDADLILELRYVVQVGSTDVSKGSGSSAEARQFRLTVIDPKTHVILWTVVENENSAIFQSNRNKNLDDAVNKLVDDVKNLIGPNPNAPQDKQKQRVK